MIISYSYLKDILGNSCPSSEQVRDKFGHLGFEVENYIPALHNTVVTVKILETMDVPGYDHLKKAIITDGTQEHQVVTGWKDIHAGDVCVWACPGTIICGLKLTKRDFERVQSEGMLLSSDELKLDPSCLTAKEREGILRLPADTPLGQNFYELFWLAEPSFDLKIPYNRPDCYAMVGILREVNAAFDCNLTVQKRQDIRNIYPAFSEVAVKRSIQTDGLKEVRVENPNCPLYLGAVISGVNVEDSPFEIRKRLFAFHIRPVNNVVDIANLIMFYYQQPLHTFDMDRLMGSRIVVQSPTSPEAFEAIDGKTYTIEESDITICDDVRPIAIGGIMGSGDSEIIASSQNIFLECAYFQPATISHTSARLNLVSDASSRFARGIDPTQLEDILKISAQLFSAVTGGTICGDFYAHKTTIAPAADIDLSLQDYKNVTGTEISKFQASTILKKLEIPFENTRQDHLKIHPPSFRVDIRENVDVIEELLRFVGYDQIKPTKPKYEISYKPEKPWLKMNRIIRQHMGALGFYEVLTDSFAKDDEVALLCGLDKPGLIQIQNPLRSDQSYLTPNRILGLLDITKRNIAMKNDCLRLYEIGKHYLGGEEMYLDWIITGTDMVQTWCQKPRNMDFYFAKGIKENSILQRYKIPFTTQQTENDIVFDPIQALDVIVYGKVIGTYGAVSPKLMDYFGITQPVFYSTMKLHPIMEHLIRHGKYQPISLNQDIVRDIAFLVDRSIPAGEIITRIKRCAIEELKDTMIFDLYQGKNIDPSKKSLAIRMLFNFGKNTTNDEIQKLVDEIVRDLEKQFHIQMRG